MSSSRSLLTSICILLDWDFSTLSYWNAITDWEGWMKTSLLMYLAKIFAGLQIFSWLKCLFFFFSLYLFFLMFNETSFDFGPEDNFIAFTGICFSFMIMDFMSSLSWCRSSFVNKRLFFFAIIFGFVAILFGVFRQKKPFLKIGEEEDFLDSLFLFQDEALLIRDVELQVIVNL